MRAAFKTSFRQMLGLAALLGFPLHAQAPKDLRCENAAAPVIDTRVPRLGWKSGDDRTGAAQTAYRVLAASTREKLAAGEADLWDSGKIVSSQSLFIPYGGKPLAARQQVWWQVKTWDHDGKEGPWSEPATWEMALTDGDWSGAQWIAWKPQDVWSAEWKARKEKENAAPKGSADGFPIATQSALNIFELHRFHDNPYDPAPLLRREFEIVKPIRSARIYLCGLGYHEMTLNGKRVGDHLLDPLWTDYMDRVSYVVHDVTADLKPGKNALGVMLGRGFYGMPANDAWRFHDAEWIGQPKLMARLAIDYADGTRQDVVSDTAWRVHGGPVVFDCPRRGEVYDARLAVDGWDLAGFDDAAWQNAVPAPAAAGKLEVQRIEPIRAVGETRPVAVTSPAPGLQLFDFGHCISGWPRLKVSGPAGTEILVRYSNYPLGEPAAHRGFQQHGYILAGKGVEVLEPRFCYASFRYVVVTGAPQEISMDDLTAITVHTDLTTAGSFQCPDPLINDIHQAVRATLLANTHGIPTDIPNREKMGWAADGRLASEATIYNFNTAAFHRKWSVDLWDTQNSVGNIGLYAPNPTRMGDGPDPTPYPCWTSSAIIVPWTYYLYYGDDDVMAQGYESMKRHMDFYARSTRKDQPRILPDQLGDWLPPKEGQPIYKQGALPHISPEGADLYGTAYYFKCAKVMESVAKVLGKNEDAAHYAKLADEIKEAFNREFYDPEMKCYRGEERRITEYRQSANAIPLLFGLVPDDRRAGIIEGLVENLVARKHRLNTGILGSQALLEVLPLVGRGDTAYQVAAQREKPSWGHMILSGSKHIWESWESGDPHQGLNSVGAFFYRHLGGIQPAEPGFKKIRLAPVFPKGLEWVKAAYQSPYGEIRSEWKNDAQGAITWDVLIPPNTSAVLETPQGFRFADDENPLRELPAGKHQLKLISK